MLRVNKCYLLVDSNNIAVGKPLINFLCDCDLQEDTIEKGPCSFADGSFKSNCRYKRKDYCISPKAKVHALKRHIAKAQTVLTRLEKAADAKG